MWITCSIFLDMSSSRRPHGKQPFNHDAQIPTACYILYVSLNLSQGMINQSYVIFNCLPVVLIKWFTGEFRLETIVQKLH